MIQNHSTSLSIQIRINPSRIRVRPFAFSRCYIIFQVKQNIRIVPVHDRSKSCDLESLYQLIAHDVNQNTNIMVFSTFSDDIDAIVYNHNVAGLAQNLDVTVSFYYQKVNFRHVSAMKFYRKFYVREILICLEKSELEII